MSQLRGTAQEGIDALNRHAYNRIKVGSEWIKIKGSGIGRKYFVSCKRKGVIYMQWEPNRANTLGWTVSNRNSIDELFEYYKEAKAKGE